VVALSESLYLSLQHRNSLVKVSVLCPGLVRTNIANSERNRPEELRDETVPLTPEMQAGRAAFESLVATSMPPNEVAEAVFDAIKKEQFYIVTHPEWMEVVRLRTAKLLQLENPESPLLLVMKVVKPK
jgi:short-subunit dehydrogenase